MSAAPMSPRDRVLELLADRALEGLSASEQLELERSAEFAGLGRAGAMTEELDLTVACADLAMMHAAGERADSAVPDRVRSRMLLCAEAFCAGASRQPLVSTRTVAPDSLAGRVYRRPEVTVERSSLTFVRYAAAAVLALATAAGVWYLSQSGSPSQRTLVTQRAELLTKAQDAVQIPWGDWAIDGQGPEIAGVKGDVVWSDAANTGYLRFDGLPPCDGGLQCYQLWIIDATRGMEQRISGAIFNATPGETIVKIDPSIVVKKAAAFAITIEQPGGTWVSDMKRRVVIAANKS